MEAGLRKFGTVGTAGLGQSQVGRTNHVGQERSNWTYCQYKRHLTIVPWTNVSLDTRLLGQTSPWKNVSLNKRLLGQTSLGQLSPHHI